MSASPYVAARDHLIFAQTLLRDDPVGNVKEIARHLFGCLALVREHGSCYFCRSGERTEANEYIHDLDCPLYEACLWQPSSHPLNS